MLRSMAEDTLAAFSRSGTAAIAPAYSSSMPRAAAFALLFSSSAFAFAQTSPQTAVDLWKQGDAAHAAKHYSEAIALYTRALPLTEESDRVNLE